MKKVVAVKETWYAGRPRFPGDEFEMSEADARILSAHDLTGGQRVRLSDNKPAEVARGPVRATKAVTSSDPEKEVKDDSLFGRQADASEPTTTGRRTYKRRDIVAED